ncbi:MAG: threonine-phosphate decarboxylase [Alphaproteobacteria bacterium]|nr:threonine-phosphate decarboxylase [Alphaproteobacteria bacterium]
MDEKDARPHHGGGLDAVRPLKTSRGDAWIDLSTGINPWPYPLPKIESAAWHRLPGVELLEAALDAARSCYGAPQDARLVAAPGSQALIQWLPWLRSRGRVAVLGHTYGEHAYCWGQAGHDVAVVDDLGDAIRTADVVVVTNPNNPDGRVRAPAELREAAVLLAARGGWLIVDEAFADLQPDCSLASAADTPGVCVLRSVGKFFGLAGLRLGFLIGAQDIADRVEAALGPWAVSGPALAIGSRALGDRAWIDKTRARLSDAAAQLSSLLDAAGFEDIGGTSLFRLVAHERAAAIHDGLLGAGILVRNFPEQPRWLRFGLPASGRERTRLERSLAAIIGPQS